MKRLTRRDFAKTLGGAALAVPGLSNLAAGFCGSRVSAGLERPPFALQQSATQDASKPGANLPLTPEQHERVKQQLERDVRRRALMRPAALPYDLEPAFVFTVRRRPRGPR